MRFAAMSAVVTLLLVGTSVGQEHAPTKDQCRADEAVWNVVFEGTETEQQSKLNKLQYREMLKRAMELGDCMRVDPERSSDYRVLRHFYEGEQMTRLVDFIDRHGLLGDFIKEDETGKR